MIKNILLSLIMLFVFNATAWADDSKQQDDVKVEKTFKKMLRAYKNKNMKAFFMNVSENRFQNDFLDFADGVREDMETNQILKIDTWVDKITTDDKKRFLYVQWDKRYQSIHSDSAEIKKSGKSMFLFEKIKGKYRLIDFGGAVLFGDI